MKIKPCIKCGALDRNTSGSCRPCKRAGHTRYKSANPDKVRATKAKYRASNPDKVRASIDKWQSANPDKMKASNEKWRLANPEKVREKQAKWLVSNRDTARAANKKWQAANPGALSKWRESNHDKCRIYKHSRRARKRNANGKHTASDIKALFTLQKGKCICCRSSLEDGYHVDHIYALSTGGSNDKYNLQLLCQSCNLSKSAKHPIDFMQSRGFLL